MDGKDTNVSMPVQPSGLEVGSMEDDHVDSDWLQLGLAPSTRLNNNNDEEPPSFTQGVPGFVEANDENHDQNYDTIDGVTTLNLFQTAPDSNGNDGGEPYDPNQEAHGVDPSRPWLHPGWLRPRATAARSRRGRRVEHRPEVGVWFSLMPSNKG
ncbi:hypothetical protein AMTR_s00017p00124160 [Amborella trichopoda]|uniref:Uncharacterized protein n=2 Tax=Amborella trichopoda TaxID=13333 RepID=W1PKJ8_AMBTC|nr:hypothetical protein AMTR_s00017p00124160 [Amborella trichopoda]